MPKKRIEFIRFARGYSIVTVVLMHTIGSCAIGGHIEKLISFGGTGVHFFFFLSGFSLTLGPKRPPLDFYRRRFATMLFPYYIVVTLVFLLNCILPLDVRSGLYAYLGHIFLFRMFTESIFASYGYHLWFIGTLLQLYLCYPLLRRLKDGLGDTAFWACSVVLSATWWIVLSVTGLHEFHIWRLFFLQFLWEFSLGMVMAEWYTRKHYRFWEENNLLLAILAAGGITIQALLALRGENVGRVFNDVPAFFGYAACAVLVYKLFRPARTVFACLGDYAYSLYLVHVVPLSVLLYVNDMKRLALYYLPAALLTQTLLAWCFDQGYRRASGLVVKLLKGNVEHA